VGETKSGFVQPLQRQVAVMIDSTADSALCSGPNAAKQNGCIQLKITGTAEQTLHRMETKMIVAWSTLSATRTASTAAMARLIMTRMFMPRAWNTAVLMATESAASCRRSR